MSVKRTFVQRGALGIMLLGLLVPTYGAARESDVAEVDTVEIVQDATALQDELRVDDRDRVDTALVFTNLSPRRQRVVCHGRDGDGHVIGRIGLSIPAGGLRYALASDLSHGLDFIGHVRCKARKRMHAASVLLAPMGVTDLSARQGEQRGSIVFPVVATY